MKRRVAVSTFLLVLALIFGLGGSSSYSYADWKSEVKIVAEVFSLVEENFLYSVDLKECRYEILESLSPSERARNNETVSGKTACLDKHSSFMRPEEYLAMKSDLMGHFGGVGIVVSMKDKNVFVGSVFEGGPAYRVGVKDGDILLRARQDNEKEWRSISDPTEAVKILRGKVGTKVYLVVQRGGKEIEFEFTREDIKIKTVLARELPDGTGYVHIKMFNSESADDLEAALRTFRKDGKKPKVIIDIRGNPGGIVGSPLEMLFYFSDKSSDLVLTQRFKKREEMDTIGSLAGAFIDPKTKSKKSPGEFKDYQIVILVDKYSASASEIFAGVMEDWGFTVVGEKTFGKGVGQTIFPLSDGSALRLTTFEFLVGNKKTPINGRGAKLTFEVKDNRKNLDDTLTDSDAQFKKALEFLKSQ